MGMVKAERFGLYNVSEHDDIEQFAVVVSPDELNAALDTVVVLPLYPVMTAAPFRIAIEFKGSSGEIAVEKITTIEKKRLGTMVGFLPPELAKRILEVMAEMFA